MGKTRCINCMQTIDEETAVCLHCGYGQRGEVSPFGLKPGTILRGRYLVGRMLGQGGFGLTYVGYDLTLEIKTAIKEYFPSGLATRNSTVSNQVHRNTTQLDQENWQAGCESFLKEARKMAKIDSLPGIVRVRDTFPENQTAYIVMDFIEGETLKQRLSKTGPMKYSACIRLLRPLMESLGRIHKQGLIHRDISPDNIMVQPDGSVCLLDFGAAKDITLQNAASQQIAKKGFSPPEQYREKGSIGSWTDVYALCATIYYCVTGKLVPDAMDRMYEDTLDFEVFFSEPLSAAVTDALRDGLRLRTEERVQTVEELLGRLEGTGADGKKADAGTGEKRADGAGTDGRGANDKADAGRQADFHESMQDDRAVFREEHEEPQDRGAGQQDDRIASGKKKVSKKAVGAAAVAVLFILAAIKLLPGSGGKETDTDQRAAVSSQTEGEVQTDAGRGENAVAEVGLPQDEGQPQDSAGEVADTAEPPEVFNMLMADNIGEIPPVNGSGDGRLRGGTVLGSKISRENIVSVQFVDTLDGAAADAWDVSQGKDGTVMAWTQPNASDDQMLDLWIGADGKIAAVDCLRLFQGYYNVEVIDFNGCFDTSRAENMREMFDDCGKLVELDVSGFDTGQVTDMSYMFSGCVSLTQLDISGFDTSFVMDMRGMFSHCKGIAQLDVSNFDTSQVMNMADMFHGCKSLTQLDVSGFDTSQVTDMSDMFMECTGLERLDVGGFDTGQVTGMSGMFACCERVLQLDVGGFDTSRVEYMAAMFAECKQLEQLDVSGFNTSQVGVMESMFLNCESLTQLDVSGFDTSQVTNMYGMFEGCGSLTQLDVSGFDMSSAEWMTDMFEGCGITAEEAGLKTE